MEKYFLIDDLEIEIPRRRRKGERKEHYMAYLTKKYREADKYDKESMPMLTYWAKVKKNVKKLNTRTWLYYNNKGFGKFLNILYLVTHGDELERESEYFADEALSRVCSEEFEENICKNDIEEEFEENISNDNYYSDELHEIVIDKEEKIEEEFEENICNDDPKDEFVKNISDKTDADLISKYMNSIIYYQNENIRLKSENVKLSNIISELNKVNEKNIKTIKELQEDINKLFTTIVDYRNKMAEASNELNEKNVEPEKNMSYQNNVMNDYALWMAKKEESNYETAKIIDKNYSEVFENVKGSILANPAVDIEEINHKQYIKTM